MDGSLMNKIEVFAARTKTPDMSAEELKSQLSFFLTNKGVVGYDIYDMSSLYNEADEVVARLVSFDNLRDIAATSDNKPLRKLHLLIKGDNRLQANELSKIMEPLSSLPNDVDVIWGFWLDNSSSPQILTLAAY